MKENKEIIFNNEGTLFCNIKRAAEEGATELLEHLSSLSEEQLTSPSFRNKLETFLNIYAFNSFIKNNYPSNSLILLESLKNKGIDIKQFKLSNPRAYSSLINSSLKLSDKINEKILLKNKKEQIAQLELVKTILELGNCNHEIHCGLCIGIS